MPFVKDPQATLDYAVDWTAYLGESAILTSSWTIDEGLTLTSENVDGLKAVAYISGGVAGKRYALTNEITYIVDGQTLTDQRTIYLRVSNQ